MLTPFDTLQYIHIALFSCLLLVKGTRSACIVLIFAALMNGNITPIIEHAYRAGLIEGYQYYWPYAAIDALTAALLWGEGREQGKLPLFTKLQAALVGMSSVMQMLASVEHIMWSNQLIGFRYIREYHEYLTGGISAAQILIGLYLAPQIVSAIGGVRDSISRHGGLVNLFRHYGAELHKRSKHDQGLFE